MANFIQEQDGLVLWPHPALSKRAQPVDFGDGYVLNEMKQLIEQMETVVTRRDGLGLAANQIGVLKRVIVVLLCGEGVPPGLNCLINPKITERRGKSRESESCLSLPGVTVPVLRDTEITVEFQNIHGWGGFGFELSGRDAVVVQHEIDHLNGVTLADKPGVNKWGANTEALALLKARTR